MAAQPKFFRGFPREAKVSPLSGICARWHAALLAVCVPWLGGCMAYHAVTTPVKVAATAVVVAGESAGVAVKTTGKVARSAIDAAGRLGGGGVDAAARLAEVGMVTFVDVASGTVVRVPWQRGFTVGSAGAQARLDLAARAIDVVRSGAVIYSARRLAGDGAELAAGDVVRIRG